jgi:hypothetical protein
VIKLDPFGKVVFATYVGGTGEDYGGLIAIDSQGNCYVAGVTYTKTAHNEAGGSVSRQLERRLQGL